VPEADRNVTVKPGEPAKVRVTRMNAWLDGWRQQMRARGLLPGTAAIDANALLPQQGTFDLKTWFLGTI